MTWRNKSLPPKDEMVESNSSLKSIQRDDFYMPLFVCYCCNLPFFHSSNLPPRTSILHLYNTPHTNIFCGGCCCMIIWLWPWRSTCNGKVLWYVSCKKYLPNTQDFLSLQSSLRNRWLANTSQSNIARLQISLLDI